MKALYIGFLVKESDFYKQKGFSSAGNKVQMQMLTNLIELGFESLDIVTIIPTAPFPLVDDLLFRSCTYEVSDKIQTKVIGFINVLFLKQITQIFFVFVHTINWLIKNRKTFDLVIYTYNYNLIISIPLFVAKIFFKFKTVCFLFDPFNIYKSNRIKHRIKNAYLRLSNLFLKIYDAVVAVNQNSIEKFHPKSKFIVVEGGVDDESQEEFTCFHQEKFCLTFAGSLYEYNGIFMLVDMMKYLNDKNIILNIFGEGPLKNVVVDASSKDSRIIYHGLVPNDKVLLELRNSDLLLNIRLVDDEISRFTFPSKLLEYLTTGVPVLSSRIDGMPSEYENVLFFLEQQSAENLAALVKYLMSLDKDELKSMGEKGKKLVFQLKTWSKQMERVFDFTNELFND